MIVGGRVTGWRRIKRKKWDNCNSIINKIYLRIGVFKRFSFYF